MAIGNTSYDTTNPFLSSGNYSGNTNSSDFAKLLTNGSLASPYGINSQNINGINLPAQTSSMISEGANLLAQQFMNRVNPVDTYGYGSDSFRSSSLFANGNLGTGVSMFDVLGSIAANTIPYIPIDGKFGFLVQSVPQIFQLVTGSMVGLQAWKEAKSMKPIENKMNPIIWDEMKEDEMNHGVTLKNTGLF